MFYHVYFLSKFIVRQKCLPFSVWATSESYLKNAPYSWYTGSLSTDIACYPLKVKITTIVDASQAFLPNSPFSLISFSRNLWTTISSAPRTSTYLGWRKLPPSLIICLDNRGSVTNHRCRFSKLITSNKNINSPTRTFKSSLLSWIPFTYQL